ncbi:hypothetical protein LEP1GSC065_0107 [Leptospira kirschneri serovar Sokoine str. RM1]|nr:hypothetical protein LEP1GSC065_0107 [Leptospira kirschneri serovar Sokoine str. RM1]
MNQTTSILIFSIERMIYEFNSTLTCLLIESYIIHNLEVKKFMIKNKKQKIWFLKLSIPYIQDLLLSTLIL